MGPKTIRANENNDLKYLQGTDMGRGATKPYMYFPNEGIHTGPGVDIGNGPDYTNGKPMGEAGTNEGELEYFTE